mgnify:CR=1 FL=1
MSKFRKYLPLAVSIGIAWGAAGLSYLLTGRSNMEGYAALNQPPLAPPGWLFPVVWSILYVLMGISATRISLAPDSPQKKQGLNLFIIQLVLNFFWSLIFFNLQAYGLAFFWLAALWITVFLMILAFSKVDPAAAWLQIPYLVWLTFAGYLSFAVWQLN